MSLESMHDLMLEELQDLYNAEQQLTKALPKMVEKTSHPVLREALESHLRETENQVVRLEQIFRDLDQKPGGRKCKGMEGLIDEGNELLSEAGSEAVRDAGIIAAAQRVEHYEIAAYGCAVTFAELLGKREIATLLKQTLEEEKAADEKLTQIAEQEVNSNALSAAGAGRTH